MPRPASTTAPRAISKAIADSIGTYRADLATKSDLAIIKSDLVELKSELRLEIAGVDATVETRSAELKELIASTQNKTLVWMIGMLVTFSGIIIGAIKLV